REGEQQQPLHGARKLRREARRDAGGTLSNIAGVGVGSSAFERVSAWCGGGIRARSGSDGAGRRPSLTLQAPAHLGRPPPGGGGGGGWGRAGGGGFVPRGGGGGGGCENVLPYRQRRHGLGAGNFVPPPAPPRRRRTSPSLGGLSVRHPGIRSRGRCSFPHRA